MNELKPQLVLAMDVLASAAHGDAPQAFGALCVELARLTHFDVKFEASPGCAQRVDEYLREHGVTGRSTPPQAKQGSQTVVVLQLAGAEPELSRNESHGVRARMICEPLEFVPSGNTGQREIESRCARMLASLDVRTVIIVVAQQIKDDLLHLRPDLSPAQISVVPLAGAQDRDSSRNASLVADVLLDAVQRFRSCPVSMLWQSPSEAPADPDAPASFLGFHNGAAGPPFAGSPKCRAPRKLSWTDALPSSGATNRPEGGLRTRGLLKCGSSDMPLVSYVTVVRNNVATLGRAIESVQRQTYANVEHIVLDGASTDGTVELIARHADRLDYFVSEPDQGLYDAINKAAPLARGQLICILNSDDWLEPHAAEIAVRRMRNHMQGAALLATGAVIYNLAKEVVAEWPPMFVHPGSYFACANVCHNGVYATRAAYECSGLYDTTYRIAADFKWVMACVDAGVDFVYTREVTVNYSLGGTSGDARGHSRECQRVVAERFPFLSKHDVHGLYDSYFLFGHQPHDPGDQVQEPLTVLLRRLFAEHPRQTDFQLALAWAAMTKLEHPSDRPLSTASADGATAIPSVLRSAKDLVKGLLHRYPLLYRAALSGYARLRR
ncbi:glycosyltransferase family 2 protein [Variovorax rhizosphaerae]|uniref:Glycosyltransferase family 2 protein n=1 Tax=Variovorax rhizosphaerae TaxID=1836200 RepID=A0ABU8WHW3_9BURK